MEHTLPEIAAEIAQHPVWIVCCHVSPDPDAIGSAAALQLILTAAGKEAYFFLPEPYSGPLEPYLGAVSFISDSEKLPKSAAIVVVDTATKERSFVSEDFFSRYETSPMVVLDHHGSNPRWGTHNYIEATAAATATIIVDLASQLQVAMTKNIASLLYAGLIDDTGSFRYSNTSSKALLAGAAMLEAGVEAEEIANALYFSIPERVMRLRTCALQTLSLHADGKIASIAVTQEMLDECNATVEDSDGIVDIARSLEGVQCALFFRQREAGWRISLRAKDSSFDVNEIASRFGGGGHRAASGCTIEEGSLDQVRASVVAIAMEQLAS